MANLVAQYGATSGDVELPQPDDRLTMTPDRRRPWRARSADHIRHAFDINIDTYVEFSLGIVHNGAGLFITAALLMSKSGGPACSRTAAAQRETAP